MQVAKQLSHKRARRYLCLLEIETRAESLNLGRRKGAFELDPLVGSLRFSGGRAFHAQQAEIAFTPDPKSPSIITEHSVNRVKKRVFLANLRLHLRTGCQNLIVEASVQLELDLGFPVHSVTTTL